MDKDIGSLQVGLVGPVPPPFGGMGNQLRQLHTLLDSEGIKVRVVQTNAPYYPELIGKVKGVRAFFRIIPYLLRLWAVAGKVDVIHVFANSGWSWQLFAAPAVWIAWMRKTPVIVNYRGGQAKNYFCRSIKWVRPTMKMANAVIVPSAYLKKVFADFDIGAEAISNIVNLDRFKRKEKDLSFPPSCPHLIVTRNLETIYGIKNAIEAVCILLESFPGLRLSIAGDGPQKYELQALVDQLGIIDHVVFTGKLPPDEIANLYHSADMMLNPTTVDNMPNSILESLACGVPVVTTNVGGIPYIVKNEETALMIEPGDAEALAMQVKRLLNDAALYHRLVEKGLEEVSQYAWPKVKEQWLTLYKQLRRNR